MKQYKYTEKAAASCVNAVLRAARKNPALPENVMTDAAGRMIVTDSYRAYRLNTRPAGVADILYADDAKIKRAADAAKNLLPVIEKLFDMSVGGGYAEIPAPDPSVIDELATAYKGCKDALVRKLQDGANVAGPYVDFKYLRELVKLFPVARWFACTENRFSPVVIVAEQGTAALCPLRVTSHAHFAVLPGEPVPDPDAELAPVDVKPAARKARKASKPADVKEPVKDQEPAPVEEPVKEEPAPAVPGKEYVGSMITGKGWRILFDGELARTRIIFDADPSDAVRALMDEAGFWYSPRMGSWNKKLTNKAHRAALAVADRLAALCA